MYLNLRKLAKRYGNVKKISGNSRYEIETPHGVAGIRGTDFPDHDQAGSPDGALFGDLHQRQRGKVIVSAVVNNQKLVIHDPEHGRILWTLGAAAVMLLKFPWWIAKSNCCNCSALLEAPGNLLATIAASPAEPVNPFPSGGKIPPRRHDNTADHPASVTWLGFRRVPP